MACPNNRPSNRLRNRPSDRPSDRHGNRLPNRPINRPSNRSSDRPSEKRKEMTLTLVCLNVARRYAGLDAFIKARKQAKNATFSHAMVDDHGNFPRWPLDVGNGSVGGLPMVNFPEVSMWGRSPWGGWGANPLPNRFEGTKNLFSAIARVDQRRRHSAVSRGLHRAASCFCADRRAFVLIGVLSALCCPNRGTHPLCCVQNWARFRTVAADRGVRQLRHFSDIFWTTSHAFPSSASAHTPRVTCWCGPLNARAYWVLIGACNLMSRPIRVCRKVVGGMPYSEGIYEDMDAVIAWQHYWDSARTANDTLREYVQFELTAVPHRVIYRGFF